MFDYLYAVTFHGTVGNGKTKPCRISAIDRNHKSYDIILKLSAGFARKETDLAIEAIGSFLACDLSIYTPQSFVIGIDPKLVNTIVESSYKQAKDMMTASYPYAYGSLFLPSFNVVTSPVPNLSDNQLKQAANIFAFDALIKNFDRKKQNPNCLTNGKDFAVIDHELAFYPKLFSWDKNAWENGYMDGIPYKDHIFYDCLKDSTKVDYSDFQSSWQSISDKRLAEYRTALPSEWQTDKISQQAIDDALTLIQDIRDNINPALKEIERVLI